MNLVNKLLRKFPMRAKPYGEPRLAIIRSKSFMGFVILATFVTATILYFSWLPDTTKYPVLVTDAQIKVDPSMSLLQMLDRGRFDTVYIESFKSGSLGGKSYTAKVRLFSVEGTGFSEINYAIKRAGYRPANEDELLAWGFKYPEEQRNYVIVATGESNRVVGNNCISPRSYLRSYDGGRDFWFACRNILSYFGQEVYVLGIKE